MSHHSVLLAAMLLFSTIGHAATQDHLFHPGEQGLRNTARSSVTQRPFNISSVGKLYTCAALAFRSKRENDYKVAIRLIGALAKQNEELNDQYLTLGVVGATAIDNDIGIDKYYLKECSPLITSVKQLSKQIGITDSLGNSATFSIPTIATEEQISTASCTLEAMPLDRLTELMAAAERSATSSDLAGLDEAMINEDLISLIQKCLKTNNLSIPRLRSSEQDRIHFAKGTHHALTGLLVVYLAKSRGSLPPKGRDPLNVVMHKALAKFNRDYY